MKQISELSNEDALHVSNLFGNVSHLSEESRIEQAKDLLCTNRLYNMQTNIPGICWYRALKYLENKGYCIDPDMPVSDNKIPAATAEALLAAIKNAEDQYNAAKDSADWFNNNTPNVGISIDYQSYPEMPSWVKPAKALLAHTALRNGEYGIGDLIAILKRCEPYIKELQSENSSDPAAGINYDYDLERVVNDLHNAIQSEATNY
jgi:hypothetical protein